jgi:glutamate 5-kinase
MRTKLTAAEWAAQSGAHTVITDGREPAVLTRISQGEAIGTLLRPGKRRLAARKRWIAGLARPRGSLIIDDGAATALRKGGRSLLPVGVSAIEGEFKRGDLVICVDASGGEVARGLVNYDVREARLLIGQASDARAAILGYPGEAELVHRDNLVLTE